MTVWVRHKWAGIGRFLLLGIIFAVAYSQAPLYTNTQNTYFVHGLAQAGYGTLSESFITKTADPFPLFSLLINVTYRVTPFLFYVYFILLCSVYVYAMLGIAVHLFGIDRLPWFYYSCFAVLVIFHSGDISSPLLWLQRGVAGQYILGAELLPHVFGVFLVLSIERFLADRPYAAVIALAVACAFHSTYLLGAAMLTLAYIGITVADQRDIRRAILIGVSALVLVFPVVLDDLIRFGPTSPDIQRTAQHILVDLRLPHHARPDNWMGMQVIQQLVVVLFGIFVARRTRLFWIMVITVGMGLGLTALQIGLDSDWLALLFPWRISVIMVPVATMVIIAWIFQRCRELLTRYARAVLLLDVGLVAIMFLLGGLRTISSVHAQLDDPTKPLMDYVRGQLVHGVTYMIPLEMLDFQLATGTPIFVDWKTHPYRDIEVIEWYERVQVAKGFYEGADDNACDILSDIQEKYGITHVVLPIERDIECVFAQSVYLDERFRVLYLESTH